MESNRISIARALELGVQLSWREAAAIVYEAILHTGPTRAARPVLVHPAACLITRGGEVVLEGDAARARPETMTRLLEHLLPACDSPGGLGAAFEGGTALAFLEELAQRTTAKRRRIEIAKVAIRGLGAEADLARAAGDAFTPPDAQDGDAEAFRVPPVPAEIYASHHAGRLSAGGRVNSSAARRPSAGPVRSHGVDAAAVGFRDRAGPRRFAAAAPAPPAARLRALARGTEAAHHPRPFPAGPAGAPRPFAPARSPAGGRRLGNHGVGAGVVALALRTATTAAVAPHLSAVAQRGCPDAGLGRRRPSGTQRRNTCLHPCPAGSRGRQCVALYRLVRGALAPGAAGHPSDACGPAGVTPCPRRDTSSPPPATPTSSADPTAIPRSSSPAPGSPAVATTSPAAAATPAVSEAAEVDRDTVYSWTSEGVEPPVFRYPAMPAWAMPDPGSTIDGPYFEVLVDPQGQVETVRVRGRIEPGETYYRHNMMLASAKLWQFGRRASTGGPCATSCGWCTTQP